MKPDWYSPHAVTRFSKEQVKWLIPRLPMLRNGEYLPNPKETGYFEQGGNRPPVKASAKFELPAGIAAELDLRIQRAGLDGLLMEFLYALEPEDEVYIIEHMAQCLNMETRIVERRIRNALYYVSGPDRKKGSYTKYIRDNHRYLKQ